MWVWYMIAQNIWLSKGKHNLKTRARPAVVGIETNNQTKAQVDKLGNALIS